MNKMAKVLGLSKWLFLLAVLACGSAENNHDTVVTPPPPEMRPDIGCAAPVVGEVNAGSCSYAHEPNSMQCPSGFKGLVRCTSPEARPMPECVSSLACDASIWCCPAADTF